MFVIVIVMVIVMAIIANPVDTTTPRTTPGLPLTIMRDTEKVTATHSNGVSHCDDIQKAEPRKPNGMSKAPRCHNVA